MTVSAFRRFKPGDRVLVRGTRMAETTIWTVIGDDTNRTPVNDHEPAYRLRRESYPKNHHNERYAYESDLIAVGRA